MTTVPDARSRVTLGRSAVSVTRFMLGCAPLGGLYETVADGDAQATLARAFELGVRAFDVAPKYGNGVAERRLGAFLSGVARDEVTVSTKVGRLLVAPEPGTSVELEPEFPGAAALIGVTDYSARGVRRSLEDSLERLGLERIDVALVHDPDDHLDQAIGEAFPALAELREEGRIGAVGAGMNHCPPLERIVAEADVDCVLVAGRYSLLDQQAGRSLFPACLERHVGVLCGGVFNGDVLANPVPGAHYDYRPAPPEILERAQAIRAVCERHGVSLLAAALHFPLRHRAVSALVVGARRAAEVDEDLALFEASVPDALYDELAERHLVEAAAS